jgi:hypothetical protein
MAASALLGFMLSACGPSEQLAACNIANKACQEDIYYALIRMRGDSFDPLAGVPPIITMTEEEYRARLEAMQPKEDKEEPKEEPKEPEEEPKVDAWDTSLQILGLVAPKTSSGKASIDNQVARVAAFYSSADKVVTVIDRGGDHDDVKDTALLLHELVHALQDRELAGDITDGTTDGFAAARALTEGEATFYEFLGHAEMQNRDPASIDWNAHYGNWLLNGRRALAKERSLFHSVRWFIYPMGARLLANAWLDGGNGGVRHAYADPRRHGVQYMVGYDGKSRPLSPALACRFTPDEGYAQKGLDRFGALQVYAFLTANQPHPHLQAKTEEEAVALAPAHQKAEAETWAVASAWVDDRVIVHFHEDEQLVRVTWRIRFRELEHPRRALELLELDERLTARADGTDLVLAGANQPEALEGFRGLDDCN